jgi:surface protein
MPFDATINLGTVGFSVSSGTISISACTDTSCTSCASLLSAQPVSNFPLTLTNVPDLTVSLYLSVDGGICAGTNQCVPVSYPPFISVWTAASPIELPYSPTGTYSGTIDWGDGTITPNAYSARTHNYAISGDYTITIDGVIEGWDFSIYATSYANSIKEILQWGSLRGEGGIAPIFNNCGNLVLTGVTDTPNLIGIASTSAMFRNCTSLTTINNIESWNISYVEEMAGMFQGATSFNQDIGSWDVLSVTIMTQMFESATSFNQDISGWNVSGVTDMGYMFAGATSFDQPLDDWNVSGVTTMEAMFQGAILFDQPLNSWNVSNVQNMVAMFEGAT